MQVTTKSKWKAESRDNMIDVPREERILILVSNTQRRRARAMQVTTKEVEAATGNEIREMLDRLTEEERIDMLIFLAGYSSLSFTAAYNLQVSFRD